MFEYTACIARMCVQPFGNLPYMSDEGLTARNVNEGRIAGVRSA